MAEAWIAWLREIGADPDTALSRFAGSTALYGRFLGKFMDEDTMPRLRKAAAAEDWAEVLTAAHTLKGVTGNLGLEPMYRASAALVAALRAEDRPAALAACSALEEAGAAVYAVLRRAKEDGRL